MPATAGRELAFPSESNKSKSRGSRKQSVEGRKLQSRLVWQSCTVAETQVVYLPHFQLDKESMQCLTAAWGTVR